MAEFKTTSLADQVFQKLEQDIISGTFPRGTVLTELKLVELLGVSRTPIREALRRLEQERLIAESGKGSVVLGITEEDLLDIMDIRQYAEGLAASYAAQHRTEEQLQELRHIMELHEYYLTRQDAEHLSKMDDQFHAAICTICGRTVIIDTIQPLHRKTQRFRKASIDDSNRMSRMVREHREIFDAIEAGDGQLASQRMTRHVREAKQNMLQRMAQNQ